MQKLLVDGHTPDLRGLPFAQATAQPTAFLMMSYNHLTAAIYTANQEYPDNVQVRKAIKDGIPNATIFKKHTPADAIEYFIGVHNSCHDNGGHSWVQLLEDSHKLATAWNLHANDQHITGAQFGYTGANGLPAQEWAYVQRKQAGLMASDKFGTESEYLRAKHVSEFLHKYDLWSEVIFYETFRC